ncbi:MAG: alpha/beta fold hydrolase [Desulfobacteraceae bacterium]|nr:alpha/beta fold hydrolase [Desulfobacteraceae bacterium]
MTNSNIDVELILKKIADTADHAGAQAKKAYEVMLEKLDTDISTTPYDIVYEQDRVKLKHYRPETIKSKTPLLIVYALINRETMLDLQPQRSVVQSFLARGQEVYMVDWGYPTRKDRFLTIDDHVNWYMDDMVDCIRDRHGLEKINLMGICMGGVFSVMYSALHPEKVKNLRMERWIFDSPDVPGETFKQFITDCYQKNLLIQNKMKLDGKLVDLKKITMPLLNIYAKYDHLVPPSSAEFLTSKVGSRDVEGLCLDTGHIGIYVSSKFQKEFAPRIFRWLTEREN